MHRAAVLTLPARQLVPHGEPGGDSEIIWGWQERTFSRPFCGIGQHSHSSATVQEPQPPYQQHRVEPLAYHFIEPETFPTKQRKKSWPSSLMPEKEKNSKCGF